MAAFSDQNIRKFREETPGTKNVTHLNNAGAALSPEPVIRAQKAFIEREAEIGGYEVNREKKSELDRIYEVSANWLNCKSRNIAYTDSATTSWLRALYSIPFKSGDTILTSEIEYASNYLSYLHLARKMDLNIKAVASDEQGRIDLNKLEDQLDDRVRLVAITHVPTNSGIINPVEKIGGLLRDRDAWYLVDACQSAGQVPLNVESIGCDFLSVTGRKYLRGPRSSGLLYASDRALEDSTPYTVDLHSAEWTGTDQYEIHPDGRRFEQWEQNLSGKTGLAAAISYYLHAGPDQVFDTLALRAQELKNQLKTINGVSVYDAGESQGGIVTFDTPADPKELKSQLSEQQINVSVSPVSSTLIDMQNRGFGDLIRASVHYYNTTAELSRFTEILEDLLNKS